jgi:nitrate/nitrite transporter NarK
MGVSGAVGGLAGMIVYFGMLADVVKSSDLPSWKKSLWLFSFLFPIVSCLYFFFVYKKRYRRLQEAQGGD